MASLSVTKPDFKFKIFDFDLTLTTLTLTLQLTEIIGTNMYRKIVFDNFGTFVEKESSKGNIVVILSYNNRYTIIRALQKLLSNDIIAKILIITPEIYATHGQHVDKLACVVNRNMKRQYIKSLIIILGIDPRQVIFFDDNKYNIDAVKELGVVSVLVTQDTDLSILMM